MLRIIDYPYSGAQLRRILPVYGDWIRQNMRATRVDLTGRPELASTTVSSITGTMAPFILTNARIDWHRQVFAFDGRKNISNNIPEIVTYAYAPIDLAQLRGVNPSLDAVMKEAMVADKIMMNVTPFMNSNGQFNQLNVFQRQVVRDYLSRTFYCATQQWFTPDIILSLAIIYSIACADTAVRQLSLDMPNLARVRVAFAVYFISQCVRTQSGSTTTPDIDSALLLITRASRELMPAMDTVAIQEIMQSIKDILQEAGAYATGMSLEHVVLLMKSFHPRMRDASVEMIRLTNVRLMQNVVESAIALEYPPVFMYGVIQALDIRIGAISHALKNTELGKRLSPKLTAQLKDVSSYPIIMQHNGISAAAPVTPTMAPKPQTAPLPASLMPTPAPAAPEAAPLVNPLLF